MKKNKEKGLGRRMFLKAAAAAAFVMSIPGWVRAFFVDVLYVRTVEQDTFRFDPATGGIIWKGKKKQEPYLLSVDGMVEHARTFTYRELLSFPYVTQVSDHHCVEGWSKADIRWGGFRFEEIVKRVKPKPEATHVLFHAIGQTSSKPRGQDHYIESHPLAKLLDPEQQCLLALKMDDRHLPHDHGSPLRLVSPFDLGYKSIKYIERIEFIDGPRPGWWTLANPEYAVDAPVPEKRLRKKKGG